MLYLESLGRIRLTAGAGRRPRAVPRLALWLLTYLALTRGRMHGTEALVERFWPDCDPARGRSNLSSTLWRLRRALPAEERGLLQSDVPGALGLAADAPLWFDAQAFAAGLAPGLATGALRLGPEAAPGFEAALALHNGELLAGCTLDWALEERERLLMLWVRGQLRWLEHCAAGRENEAALAAGAAVLRHDPLRESVHRRMIELHLANGNPCAARRQFEACARILREELGVAPSQATRAALSPIETGLPRPMQPLHGASAAAAI